MADGLISIQAAAAADHGARLHTMMWLFLLETNQNLSHALYAEKLSRLPFMWG